MPHNVMKENKLVTKRAKEDLKEGLALSTVLMARLGTKDLLK